MYDNDDDEVFEKQIAIRFYGIYNADDGISKSRCDFPLIGQ